MTMTNPEPLRRWLLANATSQDDGLALFEGFCTALVAAGLPIWRVSLAIAAIEPTARGYRIEWRPGQPTSVIAGGHGPEGEAGFRRSPAYQMIEDGRTLARWRLDALTPADANPMLAEAAAEGGTDYLVHVVGFGSGTALRGMAVSFLTDRASGFGDDDLAFIAAVLPEFGLATCKLALTRTLHETLAAYLGPASSAHVLDGQIRQGHGQTIAAAILLADLRGFTSLTDREDPLRVVGWLNAHFDALGEPIAQHGGEILKFLGDGFLAIFPVAEPGMRPCGICEAALESTQAALAANHALNARRRQADEPTLQVDLVLHYGDVVYGNVGTSRRLDFTVIGRAVNEASRIEKLCEEFDRSLLVSNAFAARCGSRLEALGIVALRGLDRAQQIWGVPGAA